MVAIKKTLENPHALSNKQKLVIADLLQDITTTGKMDVKKSHRIVYGKQSDASLPVTVSQNLNRANFREALIEGLQQKKIIGVNGKIGKVLMEGLDAVTLTGAIDHKTRLLYVQEINKITGAYAPEKMEKRSLHLNLNITDEELHNKINQLQSELGYTA